MRKSFSLILILISLTLSLPIIFSATVMAGYTAMQGECPHDGDLNEDGNLTLADVFLGYRYVAGLEEFDECQLQRADMNCDEAVEMSDIVAIFVCCIKERTSQPCTPCDEQSDTDNETTTTTTVLNEVSLSIIGTWTNSDYDGQGRSGMVVFEKSAGDSISYAAYDNSDGSGTAYYGDVHVKETWLDEQGRSVSRAVVTLDGGMFWETLYRISADGSTLEAQSGVDAIDPQGMTYSIYYR